MEDVDDALLGEIEPALGGSGRGCVGAEASDGTGERGRLEGDDDEDGGDDDAAASTPFLKADPPEIVDANGERKMLVLDELRWTRSCSDPVGAPWE